MSKKVVVKLIGGPLDGQAHIAWPGEILLAPIIDHDATYNLIYRRVSDGEYKYEGRRKWKP